MKAYLNSKDFNRAVSATKGALSKNERCPFREYIRLEFNAADSRMTAMATDGIRLYVEHVECQCDEDFITYVTPGIRLPDNLKAVIDATEQEVSIRCGNLISGNTVPEGEDTFDWRKVIPERPDFRISFNANYLIDALRAVGASCSGKPRAPVVLEFHGPLNPVIFRTGSDNIKLVMPIRIRDRKE